MDEVTKLTLAMELIENKIAECLRKMHDIQDEKIEEEYTELLERREKIYNRDFNEIEKIIEEVRGK